MLDSKTLSDQLTGVVGLGANLTDESNPADIHRQPTVFLSSAHRLLRTEILVDLAPKASDMLAVVRAYKVNDPFIKYELAKDGDQLYESIVNQANAQPIDNSAYWRKTTPLSAWYGRIERDGIDKLFNALSLNPPAPALLDRQPLFNKESNLAGALSKNSRFLGHRIRVLKRSTALNIARLGLQVTGGNLVNFPVYLFYSEQVEPVATFRLSGPATGRTIWIDVNTGLFNRLEGYYTLGYFEDDLPIGVMVIGAERNFTAVGCSNCLGVDYSYAASRAPFVSIQPVYVLGNLTSGQQSWIDEEDVRLQTWGFNLIIEVRCDTTQTLLDNKAMLTNALLHIIGCDVLEELSTTERVNSQVPKMQSAAYIALYGQQNSKADYGLTTRRDKLLSDLKAVLATVSADCLPALPPPTVTIEFESMFD